MEEFEQCACIFGYSKDSHTIIAFFINLLCRNSEYFLAMDTSDSFSDQCIMKVLQTHTYSKSKLLCPTFAIVFSFKTELSSCLYCFDLGGNATSRKPCGLSGSETSPWRCCEGSP